MDIKYNGCLITVKWKYSEGHQNEIEFDILDSRVDHEHPEDWREFSERDRTTMADSIESNYRFKFNDLHDFERDEIEAIIYKELETEAVNSDLTEEMAKLNLG